MAVKHSRFDRFLLSLNAIFLTLAVLVVIVPLVYIVVASFMDPTVPLNQGLSFKISDWSLEGYQMILSNPAMLRGFSNAVFYSTAFALLTVTVSVCAGYALSENRLAGRHFFMTLFIITIFRRRTDSYVLAREGAWHAQYGMGRDHPGCGECVEYHFVQNLLQRGAE